MAGGVRALLRVSPVAAQLTSTFLGYALSLVTQRCRYNTSEHLTFKTALGRPLISLYGGSCYVPEYHVMSLYKMRPKFARERQAASNVYERSRRGASCVLLHDIRNLAGKQNNSCAFRLPPPFLSIQIVILVVINQRRFHESAYSLWLALGFPA